MTRFRIDPRQVVHETIDGEAILIQLQTGTYYSLDSIGSEIWGLLAAGRSEDEIARGIGVRYGGEDPQIAGAVARLIGELSEERLLERDGRAETDRPVTAAPVNGGGAFTEPVLRRYTDMQDFLLVDPIHEVDESGWPNQG